MYVDQVVRSLRLVWFACDVFLLRCDRPLSNVFSVSLWLLMTARYGQSDVTASCCLWTSSLAERTCDIINMLQVTVQRNKDRLITSWLLSCFLFAFENKNVPRERREFVTDSDTCPHQVIFRCFRASGPHHLCWCVMEKGALKETYTFHWERNIKGGAPCPPYISTTAPAEVSLDGLHWLWRF